MESEGNGMISVEGYKAFTGVLRVTPKNKNFEPFELRGDFLYKPETGCWYGCGSSFCAEICEAIEERNGG